jgi:hypothetical protein
MPGATLYLDEFLEDRERKERRKRRKAFAGAIAVALFGLAAAMRMPPPKVETHVVEVPRPYAVEVEGSVTETVPIEKPVIVRTRVPGMIGRLPFVWPEANIAEITRTLEPSRPVHHLCVTPRRLGFSRGSGNDVVTVSNLGDTPICITQIGTISNQVRSGFIVDDGNCRSRQLQAGERCTISVALLDAKRETMYVLIANDAGEPDWLRLDSH